jgi:hypothetical protein
LATKDCRRLRRRASRPTIEKVEHFVTIEWAETIPKIRPSTNPAVP